MAAVTGGLYALLGMFVMISGGHFLMIYLGLELLTLSGYAMVALITVVSAVLSSLAVYWRIRQLDMIGVLKTRE